MAKISKVSKITKTKAKSAAKSVKPTKTLKVKPVKATKALKPAKKSAVKATLSKKKSEGSRRRISDAKIAKLQKMYHSNKYSAQNICDEFGISMATFFNYLKVKV